jgi:hypothetical protein
MNISDRDMLAREEAKRNRMWDPAERWRVLQDSISWAEKQLPVPPNTPTARLVEQARKLAAFRRHFGRACDGTAD